MENKHEKTKEKVLRVIQEIVDKVYGEQIEKETKEDIVKEQNKSMREFCFRAMNDSHEFIKEIKEIAMISKFKPGIQYKVIPVFIKQLLSRLFMSYKKEEYYEFDFGKDLTNKILTKGTIDDEDQQKIISLMTNKYENEIDEYFDDAVEELKEEWSNDWFPTKD